MTLSSSSSSSIASLWLFALTSSSLLTVLSATFLKNATSHVNVQIPVSLYSKSGYPHSLSKFGNHFDFWSPSGTLAERVEYDAKYGKLCHIPKGNDTKSFQPPFILMVDRGDCTFVEKVRHGQQLGASAVLIANNACLCGEVNCTDKNSEDKCHDELPIVANDGSGSDVSIPSVMLQKSDADAMKQALIENKHHVLAEISWHLPKFESNVTMDFFHSPLSMTAMTFYTNFSKLALAMNNHNKDDGNNDALDMRTHYAILDGSELGCIGKADTKDDPCFGLCTNHGRYCSGSHHGVSGKDAVVESLRRMCLSKHHTQKQLFDYIDHFFNWCQAPSSDFFNNPECIQDAYDHSGVDKTKIEDCMRDSGDVTKDETNTLLAQSITTAMEYGVQSTPAVFLNQLPIKYVVTPKTILDGLCMAFDHGMAPHVCYVCSQCGDPVACASRSPMECHADDGKDQEKKKNDSNKKGDSASSKKKRHVGRWIFFLMLFGGAGGYVYYKKFMDDGEGGGYSLTEAFMSDDTA